MDFGSGLPDTLTSFQDLESPNIKSTASLKRKILWEKTFIFFEVWKMFCKIMETFQLYSFSKWAKLRKSQIPVLDGKSICKQLSMSLISFITKPLSIKEATAVVKKLEKSFKYK